MLDSVLNILHRLITFNYICWIYLLQFFPWSFCELSEMCFAMGGRFCCRVSDMQELKRNGENDNWFRNLLGNWHCPSTSWGLKFQGQSIGSLAEQQALAFSRLFGIGARQKSKPALHWCHEEPLPTSGAEIAPGCVGLVEGNCPIGALRRGRLWGGRGSIGIGFWDCDIFLYFL